MSFLDALTILGSGIGTGFRGSQELQRQLAAAKRKELMDERDMAIREQAQRSADALAAANVADLGAQTRGRVFALGESRAASERAAVPIVPNGNPRIHLGGIPIPNRFDVLTDPSITGLIREGMDESFRASHPDYYKTSGSYGSTRTTSAREGRVLSLIQDVLGKPIPALMGEDEESYMARVGQDRAMKLNFLLNNAATIDSLYQTLGDGGSGSDTTRTVRGRGSSTGRETPKSRFQGVQVKLER